MVRTDQKSVRGVVGTSSKRRAKGKPKGRQVSEAASTEIRALLQDRKLRRDHLVEYLHLVQDTYGHLSAAHLAALAHELKISQAEVYEVASFYHHFDLVREDGVAPPPITIRVCDSISCMLQGAEQLREALAAQVDPSRVRVVHAPCMGACDAAPVAKVGQRLVPQADPAKVTDVLAAGDLSPLVPASQSLASYRDEGGFRSLLDLRSGTTSVDEILRLLEAAGLRGLGGAGFPAFRKWTFVRSRPGPRYLCVNADEGEPGTFKDRYFLEQRPFQFLEGVLIAAWGVEAEQVYIYLRDEYPEARVILLDAVAQAESEGLIPAGYVELRRGAGAYICGEESAMIESIEGKRGLPRHRPPYVAQAGLFGRPTLVHNVETLSWLPLILRNGSEWFSAQGKPGHKGPRTYSVSGRVRRPGLVLAPAGSTVRELIERCGGMAEGHSFAAYLPGGASGGILPASLGDLPLDFGTLEQHGCFVGSHAIVVLSDQDDLRIVARNLMEFFRYESCGQCTPCRVGTEKAVGLMKQEVWDEPLMRELARTMADASICGLGQAAPNAMLSVLKAYSPATTNADVSPADRQS